jgi:hypothetical protein
MSVWAGCNAWLLATWHERKANLEPFGLNRQAIKLHFGSGANTHRAYRNITQGSMPQFTRLTIPSCCSIVDTW